VTAEHSGNVKTGVVAVGGAVLASALCVVFAIGIMTWRARAQRRALDDRSTSCERGTPADCDALRSICLKKSGDACAALADAELTPGARQDARDGVRLLTEACEYRHRDSCLRAGRLLLEGDVVPKDVASARALLDHGCEFGAHEACALRQTVP
jgi:hypothetical protein